MLAVAWVAVGAIGQSRPASANDPRVGLKPGYKDAGVAARNLELVKSFPKPDGFFDPKSPLRNSDTAGTTRRSGKRNELAAACRPASQYGARRSPPVLPELDFANSDIAFARDYLFMGNFNGFTAYSIEDHGKGPAVAAVVCPGGQGDVSVYGNLLFMSVEQTRGRIDCGTQGVKPPVSAERFRGVRIFDISNISNPKQIAAVQTCRGSHTHTSGHQSEGQSESVRLCAGHRPGARRRRAGGLHRCEG